MIKLFEQYNQNVTTKSYYKLFIYKSYEKLQIALEKLGILDEFNADWNIKDDEYNWDDIMPENQKIITNNNVIYLTVNTLRRFTLYPENEFNIYLTSYKNCGEVKVTDEDLKNWEIKNNSKKYNI